MAFSTAFIQQETDSIAKAIIDSQAVIGSTSGILTGIATWLARIAALNNATDEYALLDGAQATSGAISAWITQEASYNAILDNMYSFLAVLDAAVAGLPAYLQANTLQVAPQFLDAFNRAVSKGNKNPGAVLKAFQAFGNAVANMGQLAVTGGTTGTFTAGTAVAAAYGNAPLFIFNAGGGNTGAQASNFTVTYNKYDNAGVLLTGQTATATMPATSVPNTAVALSGSAAGVAVTGISVTSGNNGDLIAVKSTLLRAVTY